METKTCSNCKEFKNICNFHKCKSRKDGYEYICKVCKKKKASKYYKENKEYVKADKALYFQKNFDKISKQQSEYAKEKCKCDICGSVVTKKHLKRHQRTIKCTTYKNSLNNNEE